MTKILHADLETYSAVDLKSASTHNYADGAEVTVFAYALDDQPSEVWDLTTGAPMPKALANALYDPSVVLQFHNSHFDRTVLRRSMGIDLPPDRFIDTMVQAMAHSLPGALAKLGFILGLAGDEKKLDEGKELVMLFCKPRPKNAKVERATRLTHPTEWERFLAYAKRDVEAMRSIGKKLPSWNFRGAELDLWRLDQRINDRGFAVDVQFAEQAVLAAAQAKQELRHAVTDATAGAVSSATKRDEMLKHILAEYGVALPDLTSDTLKRRLEDPTLPEGVKLLIAIRLEAGMASAAKYKALCAAASPDGRLRNTTAFAGAQRTGRWSGKVFQPQNMKRPDPDMTAENIEVYTAAVKAGVLDLVTDSPMRVLANTVRGCIVAPQGKKLCISDLSNIEGRVLVWLAEEQWKLDAFSQVDNGVGHDTYKLAYAKSFNTTPELVDKNQRQIGKVQELALGYEGGVGAFLTFAAVYDMDLEQLAKAVHDTAGGSALFEAGRMYDWTVSKKRSTFGLPRHVWVACELLKAKWRAAHPAVCSLWRELRGAVVGAIQSPGVPFSIVGGKLKAQRDGAWLRIRLPSGRCLCYLNPKVGERDEISYMGVNQYTRKWDRLKTYGGKLVENVTQAVARDVLAHNMQAIEAAGYPIVLSVHDELLTETPDSPEFSSAALSTMMSTVPPWGVGLPLAAAGFETYRYRKD
jgi:DNA polymerase